MVPARALQLVAAFRPGALEDSEAPGRRPPHWRDFILAHADDRVRRQVERSSAIRFVDYDWNLNSPANFPEFK